jgi:hypothetical protein
MTAHPKETETIAATRRFKLVSQRAAERSGMHPRRVTSMMREARCSQVERTYDQVEQ